MPQYDSFQTYFPRMPVMVAYPPAGPGDVSMMAAPPPIYVIWRRWRNLNCLEGFSIVPLLKFFARYLPYSLATYPKVGSGVTLLTAQSPIPKMLLWGWR